MEALLRMKGRNRCECGSNVAFRGEILSVDGGYSS